MADQIERDHNTCQMTNSMKNNFLSWSAQAGQIEKIFRSHREMLGGVVCSARKVKKGIQIIDPFIQHHTSVVCHRCRKVCCVGKNAYYDIEDLIYLNALGHKPEEFVHMDGSEPCRFLSFKGCRLERTIRPSGCNWYFCETLLEYMENTSLGGYKEFDETLQDVIDLWKEMVNDFKKKEEELNRDNSRGLI